MPTEPFGYTPLTGATADVLAAENSTDTAQTQNAAYRLAYRDTDLGLIAFVTTAEEAWDKVGTFYREHSEPVWHRRPAPSKATEP